MLIIINIICPHCGKDIFPNEWKEEKELEWKLNKEMPPRKFKEGDPFEKGGWSVPCKELKELLNEG